MYIHIFNTSGRLVKFKNESIVKVIEELMNRKQNKLKRLIELYKFVCLSSSLIPGKKLVIE